jgi:glucokinase
MLLVGDVGGTKVDLAVYSREAGPRAPVAQAELPSARFASLEEVARAFLDQVRLSARQACFAVAGPVQSGRAELTNLPWVIDESRLARELGLEAVYLLNDLEAMAYAIPLLGPADLRILSAREPVPGGTIAVIAPGTGLGEAFLTWDGRRYRAHASEGGHADFAPTDALQIGLIEYLQGRFGHVSVERACSGIGIPHLYTYLRGRGTPAESPALADELAAAADETPVILARALDPTAPDPLCAATLDLFVRIFGAEAGNLALKVLATGGVYLAGGIPQRILPALEDGRFLEAFRDKGRMGELLAQMPVQVILARAALLGAAAYGLEHMS